MNAGSCAPLPPFKRFLNGLLERRTSNEIRDFLTKQSQDKGCVVACPCGNKEPGLPLFSSAIAGEVFHINRHIPDHGDGGLPFGSVL